jgi:hypothetical protein
MEIVMRAHSIPSGPYEDLERNRISPEEYGRRTREEVRREIEKSPPPPPRPEPTEEKSEEAD